MRDRLAPLLFLPPPINTPWTGVSNETPTGETSRAKGEFYFTGSPLFWYDPNWCDMAAAQADSLAVAVAEMDTLVSALRSELAPPDQCSKFHSQSQDVDRNEPKDSASTQDSETCDPFPRIVPYRPERYGLTVRDFDGASVIDLRLTMSRDESGTFRFFAASDSTLGGHSFRRTFGRRRVGSRRDVSAGCHFDQTHQAQIGPTPHAVTRRRGVRCDRTLSSGRRPFANLGDPARRNHFANGCDAS